MGFVFVTGNRHMGATCMNEQSSRSHTIFRLTIESKARDSEMDGAVNVSQLVSKPRFSRVNVNQ